MHEFLSTSALAENGKFSCFASSGQRAEIVARDGRSFSQAAGGLTVKQPCALVAISR
jgi:hypothetical protein